MVGYCDFTVHDYNPVTRLNSSELPNCCIRTLQFSGFKTDE